MLHPNKFFSTVMINNCNSMPIQDMRQKLIDTHPLNFLKSQIEIPVYKVKLIYETHKNNLKISEKIFLPNVCSGGVKKDTEYNLEFLINKSIEEYKKDHTLKYVQIIDINHICDVVLQFG